MILERNPGRAYSDQLRAHFSSGLILRQRHICEKRWVTDNTRVGVAMDVGLPFPARRVGVSGANVFGLEAFQLLLGTEFVGLLYC